MRIGTRISVGFLSFTILLVLVLIYQYSTIRRVVELTGRLSAVDYEMGQSTVQLLNDLTLVEEFTAKFFISTDPEPYSSELKDLVAEIRVELARLSNLEVSEPELKQLAALGSSWSQFEERLGPRLETGTRGTDVEAAREVDAQLMVVNDEVRKLFATTRLQLEAADRAARVAGQRALRVALIAVLVALIMGPLATFFIVRTIMGPLQTLRAANRRLASGDFTARIQPPADEDMASLARNFNRMVRDLRELEGHKKEFFSAISHELKAPLASMQETTSLLLEGLVGDFSAQQQRMLQLNHRSGERLMRLLNNILDYSRLEAGALRYVFRETTVQPILQEVLLEMQGLILERESTIGSDLPEDPISFVGDPERLMQVFRNLLDNALKYSPAGSLIIIQAVNGRAAARELPERIEAAQFETGDWIRVNFRDQAVAIPDAERENIFRRYHQTQGRPVRSGGVGLGLAIARSIVLAHGGFIWVEADKGGGNCFSVVLRREGPAVNEPLRSEERYV